MSDTKEMESASETGDSGANKKKQVTTIGDFELKKKLGNGATGEVFLARQVSLDRPVAVKTLSKELTKKEDAVARFLREARSMDKLDHPNIVKFYVADSYKGIHYVAIEYVNGKSIQNWLDKLKQFSIGDAVHIAMVTAEALKHAHDQNMVHRDVKPDNIMLTSAGVVKVADFGLVKTLDEDVALTQNDTGLGTPLYMAPEQAVSAKTVDQRSDIYSLGATLYHMLTGVLPYSGQTAVELIMAKERGVFEAARKLRPEIPERLDLMIDKMLAKDPKHRYKNCAEVVRDLASVGVHNAAISFVDDALPTSVGSEPTSELKRTSPVMGITMDSAAPTPGGRHVPEAADDPEESIDSGQTWFVQYRDAEKKTIVKKMSTARVLKLLKAGKLSAKARAKVTATGYYLPLAEFAEFTEAIEQTLQRNPADVRHDDLKNVYKKARREQKQETPGRSVKDRPHGMMGNGVGIACLLAIGLLLWLGAMYGRVMFEYLGQVVTDMMN
ncbi:MAG: serine/threonine protein kinase [Fuerstiella sp.]|nr:serine/threonine protein kinase [Fuerstiella sp.]MCP4855103.1 serine/threonine protein kinase [Fuerstiella sp.]